MYCLPCSLRNVSIACCCEPIITEQYKQATNSKGSLISVELRRILLWFALTKYGE